MANESLDEAVMRRLRDGGLSDASVARVVRVIGDLEERGAHPVRCFPKGVPNEGAIVEVEIPVDLAPELVGRLVLDEYIDEVRSYSLGVPATEKLLARLTVW